MRDGRAKKIAVAHDTTDRDRFFESLKLLGALPLVHKIGLKMLPRLENKDWKVFSGKELFVDAKLHDIPTQVADAVAAYGDLGAHYVTVHLSGGIKMLEAAQKAAQPYRLRLLGVSVLTSLADEDLQQMGMPAASVSVEKLVKLGLAADLDAFVMSAAEVAHMKGLYPHIYCVTPGISLEAGQAQADQSRTATIAEALKAGSDMLVIGRAILQASDPKIAAERALKMLEK